MVGSRTFVLQFIFVWDITLCGTIQPDHADDAFSNLEEGFIIDGDIMLDKGDIDAFFTFSQTLQHKLPDMVLDDIVQDEILPQAEKTNDMHDRRKRAVAADPHRKWPDATIPYVIGDDITKEVEQYIREAMGHWEKHTCIKFVKRKDQNDFIVFNPGHCGPDRDNHVDIIWKNIIPKRIDNFLKKKSGLIDSLGQPYDYYSIMHYRKQTFGKKDRMTMRPKKPVEIGQRTALSPGDVLQTKLLYSCPKPVCYEEFTATTYNFTSPNYPLKYFADHTCIWIIHVFPGEEVLLQFTDFDVEPSTSCTFDYLEIREGIDETGFLIGRLCGTGYPGSIQSENSLWIQLVSDMSFTKKGFHATYTKTSPDSGLLSSGSGSGEETESFSGEIPIEPTPEHNRAKYIAYCSSYHTAQTGTVVSPLMPIGYAGRPAVCSWTIDAGENGSAIQITIDRSSDAGHCVGDLYQKVTRPQRHHSHVQLVSYPDKDGSAEYDIDRYARVRYDCGRIKTLLLETHTLMVEWSSDINPQFSLSYIIDYDECELGTAGCAGDCHNTVLGFLCSCPSGYMLHTDDRTCLPKAVSIADRCNATLLDMRGKIRMGTEPMTDCYFHIAPPGELDIQITFTKFRVPSNITDGKCDNFVAILSGGKLKHTKGVYCGLTPPEPVVLQAGSVSILAHTDRSATTLPYFSATYIAYNNWDEGKCFHKIKAVGKITSPDHPRPYPPNTNCVWRVSAPKGSVVKATFVELDVEKTTGCDYDYVEVRDGKHKHSNWIGQFCGTTLPEPITSTGRHLRLTFLSDKDGNGKGFVINLSSVASPGTIGNTSEID